MYKTILLMAFLLSGFSVSYANVTQYIDYDSPSDAADMVPADVDNSTQMYTTPPVQSSEQPESATNIQNNTNTNGSNGNNCQCNTNH